MGYRYKDSARIAESRIEEGASRLLPMAERMAALEPGSYAMPEAGIAAAQDGMHAEVAARVASDFGIVEHVVLVGIGGSSIGTEAVYGALKTSSSPKLTVLDVADSARLEAAIRALQSLDPESFAIVIVSKSGTTTETLANASVLLSELEAVHGEALRTRIVAVGDADTALARHAQQAGFRFVPIPAKVGGRFSIFTAAGLIPLALLGIDIRAFRAGAEKQVRAQREGSDAVAAALVQYCHGADGAHTHMLFASSERLVGLTRWYEQLLAESLGKEKTRNGGVAPLPLAPHLLSSRELHSTAQLYLSRFPGTFTTFFEAESKDPSYVIAEQGLGALVSMGSPRDYGRIPRAIIEGVERAYEMQSLPFAVVQLGALAEESLGSCMAERMLEVLYLAELMDVDAFDQPHVELYKQETRAILS